jgi:hypothetical protein
MFAEMEGNISKNVSFQNNEFFDPKLEESTLTVLIILYSLTTTLSIIGNILVVIVFKNGNRSRTDLNTMTKFIILKRHILGNISLHFREHDAVWLI